MAQATRNIHETYGSPLVSPLSFSTFNHTTDLNFTTETSAIDTAHRPTDIARADAQESLNGTNMQRIASDTEGIFKPDVVKESADEFGKNLEIANSSPLRTSTN